MNNNIKIEYIKNESLKTEEKEFLVSGLFSMMSNEDNQFVSKEKYDNLQSKIEKAIDKLEKYGLVDKNGNFNAYLDTIELKELYNDLKDDK